MSRHFSIILLIAFLTALLLKVVSTSAEERTPSLTYPPTPIDEPTVIAVDEIANLIDTDLMFQHIEFLSVEIGARVAGTEEEYLAGEYIIQQLESYGYPVELSPQFLLDNGRESRNISAKLPGEREEFILVGAHYDSKSPSPGANDNASGVAVVLELARILAGTIPTSNIMFVFFGAEEIIDSNSDHHHYGSRYMAEDDDLLSGLSCMTSIDMVGTGTEFWIDNMGISDDYWRSQLESTGQVMGLEMCTGETRAWSDHEAFESKGIPVAWVHWRYDNEYHSSGDVIDRIQPDHLANTAELVIRAIFDTDEDSLIPLRDVPVVEFMHF